MTQGTVSTIHQAACPRAALQLDQETAYSAGCQRVVNQLIRGCTSTCPGGCVSDSHLTPQLFRGPALQPVKGTALELDKGTVRQAFLMATHRSDRKAVWGAVQGGCATGCPRTRAAEGCPKRYACIKAFCKASVCWNASMYQAAIICTEINRRPCPL